MSEVPLTCAGEARPHISEYKPQRKLELPRRVRRARDLAEARHVRRSGGKDSKKRSDSQTGLNSLRYRRKAQAAVSFVRQV